MDEKQNYWIGLVNSLPNLKHWNENDQKNWVVLTGLNFKDILSFIFYLFVPCFFEDKILLAAYLDREQTKVKDLVLSYFSNLLDDDGK